MALRTRALCTLLLFLASHLLARAFDIKSSKGGLAVYWGQNSLSLQAGEDEMDLGQYCTADNPPDIILVSFHHVFTQSPQINLSKHCGKYMKSSVMLNCTFMEPQIKACQDKGIKVILSMGGAAGAYSFASNSDGAQYAQVVYDTFLGGKGNQRPFGQAVLDGVDLDIEGGGPTGYADFTSKLHEISPGSLITGAPQCPYPDHMLDDALQKGWFDAIFVQFYNNYCNAGTSAFNFDTWADWARKTSKNKGAKVYIGSPACEKCASTGYIGADKLTEVYKSTLSKHADVLGGIMLWDAGAAYYKESGGTPIAVQLKKNALGSSGSVPSSQVASSSAQAALSSAQAALSSAQATSPSAPAQEASGSSAASATAVSTSPAASPAASLSNVAKGAKIQTIAGLPIPERHPREARRYKYPTSHA